MSQRETNLLWLSDLIDQLKQTQQQLQWTEDRETMTVLADSMIRDLESCRRLCESLRRSSRHQYAA
jgi:hypothetical protein